MFRKRRNRKKELCVRLIIGVTTIAVFTIVAVLLMKIKPVVTEYVVKTYGNSIYKAELFATDLCVTSGEKEFEEFVTQDEFHGALLFNIETQEVLYAEHAHEKLYPASTTKLMTTYVALKHGDLGDTVTVSENATKIPSDSSKANLKAGDQLTLLDLLYGLMLPSGNDSAVAIAEHISGSEEAFAELMNEEAKKLGASNSHFVNAHGYQDEDHYTTAYDLYLILNACVKDDNFVKIISAPTWDTVIVEKNGARRNVSWRQGNRFVNGARKVPEGITVVGGKTGTTYEAGYCLALYGKNASETPYIGIIMGATSSRNLYDNMTSLLRAIPN